MSPALPNNTPGITPRKSGVRVLVIAGPSGGHIFPALGFLDTLKNRNKDMETLLVLPKKIKIPIEKLKTKISYICISRIKFCFNFKTIFAILNFLKGAFESLFILLRFKPDIVVGFGSLVSIPLILFSRIFNIKTLIHEQNVIPGRANRFLAGFSDKIAVSFAGTKDYFRNYQQKLVLTGNPLRSELKKYAKKEALDFFGLSENKFTILVMGGSLGSHNINLRFPEAISEISDKHNLQFIHLSGFKDYDFLNQHYKDLNINVRLFSFLDSMQYAYSACDLVISRSGATAISEIISFRLAAILIPYPLAYQHQLENAKVLQNLGSATIIDDPELNTDILKNTLEDFIHNPDKIKTMCSCYEGIPESCANDLLVDEVLSLIK